MLEFIDAMKASNLHCHEPITADGEVHRFASGRKGNKNAWYILFEYGGAYGDWGKGISEKWTPKSQNLSNEQKESLQAKIAEAKALRNKEVLALHEETARKSLDDWNKLTTTGTSQYLERKQVQAFGLRFGEQSVVVPLKDVDGNLWSLQVIYHDGKKRFSKGGRKKGCFHVIGDLKNNQCMRRLCNRCKYL
jgi:putative DNA primase/helicase